MVAVGVVVVEGREVRWVEGRGVGGIEGREEWRLSGKWGVWWVVESRTVVLWIKALAEMSFDLVYM